MSSRKVCDWVDSNPNLLGDIKMHMQDYEKADELLAALNKEMKNDSAKEYLLAINKYRSTQRILVWFMITLYFICKIYSVLI